MEENLELYKGNSFSFTLEIEDLNQDLNSCFLSCKKNIKENNYTFQKSLKNGISKVDSENNKRVYSFKINPEDTKNIEVGCYYYDVEIKIDNDVFTILCGKLIIKDTITKGS